MNVRLKTEKSQLSVGFLLAERPVWCHYIFMSVYGLQSSCHTKEHVGDGRHLTGF